MRGESKVVIDTNIFILECAISSPVRPECIVTGDKDLLVLKSFHGIPILKPKEFLVRLKK